MFVYSWWQWQDIQHEQFDYRLLVNLAGNFMYRTQRLRRSTKPSGRLGLNTALSTLDTELSTHSASRKVRTTASSWCSMSSADVRHHSVCSYQNHLTKAPFPFKRNRLRCVRSVNENRKKRKRLRLHAANHGCHCFDRAFLLAGACVCCVKDVSCGFRLRNARNASDCVWMETGLEWPYYSENLYSLSRKVSTWPHV